MSNSPSNFFFTYVKIINFSLYYYYYYYYIYINIILLYITHYTLYTGLQLDLSQ
jgi:hypothetical protein